MSEFYGYEKIVDSAERWRLDPKGWRLLRKARWVVTEKIHGANFCFVVEGDTVRCANRRALLAESDSFFGFQRVRDALQEQVREVAARVCKACPNTIRVFLYGELFGGGYPHAEVSSVSGVQPVQTGVWYAPDIRFAAFDLRIESKTDSHIYMDFEEAIAYWEQVGLFHTAPVHIGSYESATAYPVRFDSTIPSRLGLPTLPVGTNLAEGVVLKPLREIVIPTPDGPIRPVLKRKLPEFAEDRRFHEAEKWTESGPKTQGAFDMLCWEAYNRITVNRWNAALSKVGRTQTEQAQELFIEEIATEVQEALPDTWREISDTQHGELRHFIEKEMTALGIGIE